MRHQIIFITGFARCGTTLLQRLIADGENYPFFPESNAISQLLRSFAAARRMSEDRIAAYFGSPEDLRNFYRSAIEQILERLVRGEVGRKFVVLKDPLMLDVALEAKELFHTAHLVVMVRDPLDVLSSRKAVWERQAKASDLERVIEITVQEARRIRHIAKSEVGAPHICRYELLCREPEQTIKLLADRIGFAPKLWQAAGGPADSPFRTDLSEKEISPASIGRHHANLTAPELERAQQALAEARRMVRQINCFNDPKPQPETASGVAVPQAS